MKATVKDRQTLADIALQYGGDFQTVVELAELNGISITDDLVDGQELETPDTAAAPAVVRRYKVKGVEPATALSEDELSAIAQEGINFMGIEIDFIVS